MALNVPELEQRLSSLQLQIESLRDRSERQVPSEAARLSGLADEYAGYLKQWAHTVERHTRAVAQLEAYVAEWKHASGHVQEMSAERLTALETMIEREWQALRAIHEEPVNELREQANNLTALCVNAATAAEHGWERAEQRLVAFQDEFHQTLSGVTTELRTAIAELKSAPDRYAPRPEPSAQWALDDVTRLHSQLRAATGSIDPPAHTRDRLLEAHDAAAVVDSPRDEHRSGRRTVVLAVLLGAVVIGVGVFGWRQYTALMDSVARSRDAEIASAKAAEILVRQTAQIREQSAQELASARDMAARAQRISGVLAAPDLIRYNLATAGGDQRVSGQALWSRSRGVVFSGSRLPAAGVNQRHTLWLITRGTPVKAGAFVPDADGTVTAVEPAPYVSRPVIGVIVTAEADNDAQTPSADVILTSISSVPTN